MGVRNRGSKVNFYEILRIKFFLLIKHRAKVLKGVDCRQIKRDYLNGIIRLARVIDANDTYARGHCAKVMKYSVQISRRLELPPGEVKTIKIASILHDIGKVGIDLSILRKAGKLTDDDWKKIKKHPVIGARIVKKAGILDEVVPIIKYHHARYSGGGYPDPGMRNSGIPLGSRIIAVADSFDAMTTDRPYRKAMPKEAALAELNRCSGEQFDPNVVNAFMQVA